MKKNLFALLISVLVLAVVCCSFASPAFARRKLGDVDGNGKIDAADARLALRASVKLETLSEEETLAANVDKDAFVTSADARSILRASVLLETLPDEYVEGSGTATPTEPDQPVATPTEPDEPVVTPTEPDEPVVTPTEPDQPVVTPTEPDQPVATPTEPDKPDDPEDRGIIPPAEDNEYDILRSDTYAFSGVAVDSSGKSDLQIARTPDTLYMGAKFNSTEVALLKIGKKAYLIYPEKNVYLDLNTVTMKAQLKLMNFDIDEMLSSDMFDFSYFPDLTQATYCERLEDDPEGVKYVFETEDGAINVTMSGKTLVCLESAQDGNVYRIDFYSVSKDVPSEMKSLKGMDGISETKFFYYMAKG